MSTLPPAWTGAQSSSSSSPKVSSPSTGWPLPRPFRPPLLLPLLPGNCKLGDLRKKCGNLWCIQMVASLTDPLKKWNCAVESRVSWDWRLMKIESVHCFMHSCCFMISSDSWQSSRFFPTWSNAKRFASNLLFNATWGFLKSLYISETYHNPDINKNP